MIVNLAGPTNGESSIVWTGERSDLDACCNFLFGDGEPCAIAFNSKSGQIVVNDKVVRPGDMIHKSAEGVIRVLIPVAASVGVPGTQH